MKMKTFQHSDVMGSNFNFWCGGSVLEIPFEKKNLYVITQRNIYLLMNRYCFYKFFYIINFAFTKEHLT